MGEKGEAHEPNRWDKLALAGTLSGTRVEHKDIGANQAISDKHVPHPTAAEVCAAMASPVTKNKINGECSARPGDLPGEMLPQPDRTKSQARLTECRARAQKIGCEGMATDTCQVRASMDESPVQGSAVQIFRGIFRRNVVEG